MSVIAIVNVPPKLSLKHVMKLLATTINGRFETLNFISHGKKKTCYLHLSEKLDPCAVVEKINNKNFGQYNFKATIPNVVPDLAVSKPRTLSKQMLKKLKLSSELSLKKMSSMVHTELLKEIQSKYTGLAEISVKCENRLLIEISEKIRERLEFLSKNTTFDACFQMSRFYRKKFPHTTDFELIVTAARTVRATREPLTLSDLKPFPRDTDITAHLPLLKTQKVCGQVTEKIIEQIHNHIRNLNMEPDPEQDPVKEAARIKVRQQLQKIQPYLPEMVSVLVKKYTIPKKDPSTVLRLYGEPFLPGHQCTKRMLSKFGLLHIKRSPILFNMLTVKVQSVRAPAIRALDSTVLNGCKLIVRPLRFEKARLPNNQYGNELYENDSDEENEDFGEENEEMDTSE